MSGDRDLFNPNLMRDDMHDGSRRNEKHASAARRVMVSSSSSQGTRTLRSADKLQTFPAASMGLEGIRSQVTCGSAVPAQP